MALVGDYIEYSYSKSETDTEKITVTHPDTLPVDHPMYEKRGQTEVIDVPLTIEHKKITENVYLVVHSYTIFKNNISKETKHLANITYRIYDSKESRDIDNENYIIEDALFAVEIDPSHNMSFMYELIRQKKGMENLKQD